MRLVSWNCCDAFQRKFGHLERLRPDIAVIQEVRPECLQFAAVRDRSVWIGDPGQKGLAVIAYGDWKIARALVAVNERWFVPLILSNGVETIHLVAVWVDSSKDCVAPTLRALEQLGTFLTAAPSIMTGDFNQTVALDKGRPAGNRFADVLKALAALNMASAWHSHRCEEHGEETVASLYWRWNERAKYHIDFAFGSNRMRPDAVSLGTFEHYVRGEISDHVPLVADYTISE